MAEGRTEFDKISDFAKALRTIKCNIDKDFTVGVSPILSEMKFKQYSVKEIDEGINSMEEVLKGLKDISETIGKVKEDFQEAKIQALQKQLRRSQIREDPGRSFGQKNDSGCYSACYAACLSTDSRVLSTSSAPVVQASDAGSEDVRAEATQHEDTSDMLKDVDDSSNC